MVRKKNDVEMYSTHNERKFLVAERFIRTLKNKIYKHMTSISKNVYIIKILNIMLGTMQEYQNLKSFLRKVTLKFGSKKFLILKKVKNTASWTYFINDLNRELLMKKSYKKQIKKNFG